MRILNFGSLNIDHVYDVPHILRGGETLASTGYRVNLGGKGFNQSVALANAGVRVSHAGCVGPDGDSCRAYLEAHHVDTACLSVVDAPTGHTVIQVDAAGQNGILLFGGANLCVTPPQIDAVLSQFSAGDYLLLQNEISHLDHLVREAARRGMRIVLNPSPISKELLLLPFECVEWLLLNEIEGAALGGGDTSHMLARLHERFPACSIVLTLGEQGSICWRDGARHACPAFPVAAVDTTAAGDTFTGYFLCGILEGLAVRQAMELGSAAAAIAVTKPGAADSIPVRDAVEAFLATAKKG